MVNEQQSAKAVELMIAYQAGHIEAFESLYRILQPVLFQYLLYKTYNHARAEDLLQESFLQMHRSRSSYLPDKPVLPWAFAIARNVYLMDQRARQRRYKHETSADSGLPDVTLPPELEHIAERQALRQALSQLDPGQREIILMHHFWGLSFHEIAGVIGIRRGAAKLRAHRAIKSLRTILKVPPETG
jgi:RNA polymerase sigma-70 factor (ECF subfamily)